MGGDGTPVVHSKKEMKKLRKGEAEEKPATEAEDGGKKRKRDEDSEKPKKKKKHADE